MIQYLKKNLHILFLFRIFTEVGPVIRSKLTSALVTVAVTAVSGTALSAAAQDTRWHAHEAGLRFTVDIIQQPSTPSAGVLAKINDGGLLPGPELETLVVDSQGQKLENRIIWHNRSEGIALVFEPPEEGRKAFIYFRGIERKRSTSSATFHPGVLLFTRAGRGSLRHAERLAQSEVVSQGTSMGTTRRFSHAHNPFGPDDSYLSYYSGWIKLEQPKRIYFATMSQGASRLRVNGRNVGSSSGRANFGDGLKGQHGRSVQLTEGFHHVEYFHYAEGDNQVRQALWNPDPGTSYNVANIDRRSQLPRVMSASDFVRSGRVRIIGADFKDDRPIAMFEPGYQSYMWMGDKPLNLFVLRPDLSMGNSEDTQYIWKFANHRQIKENEPLFWVFEGSDIREVTLTVKNKKGSSSMTLPAKTTADNDFNRASVNDHRERARYREALRNLCRAVPEGESACKDWSNSFWNVLVNVVEPYDSGQLLKEIFMRSREEVLDLDLEERRLLEDMYIEHLPLIVEKENGADIIRQLKEEANESERRLELYARLVEYYTYVLEDFDKASATLETYEGRARTVPDRSRGMIKQADMEMLQGNYDKARRRYAAAQDDYHDYLNRRYARAQLNTTRRRDQVEAWKKFTVRKGAYFAEITSLIDQREFQIAREKLLEWEITHPTSKLNGNYILAEGKYYYAIGHTRRALRLMRMYRESVDIESNLPQVMEFELRCLDQLGEDEQRKALAEEIVELFPEHSAAERARRILNEEEWTKKGMPYVPYE